MSPDVNALAALARHWLRRGIRRTDAIGDELRRVDALIPQVEAAPASPPPADHPALRHLPTAVQGFRDLDALTRNAPLLPWRHGYQPDPSRPGLYDGLAWTEIIGPEAPLRHSALCVGFLLLAPHTHYPAHAHPAVEVYHVISGLTEWTAGQTTTERRPGDFILHPSGMRHAMSTAAEPLLAIYTWTGDVTSSSRFVA
jgi:quercetin dioxygenase-like cupin family protein